MSFILAVPVQIDRTGAQLIFFGGTPTGLPMWLTPPIVFLAVDTDCEPLEGIGLARSPG